MKSKKIQATDTAFDIVEELHRHERATITELATALDLSTSTVHGHLVTLEDRGYVVRNDGAFQVGLRFFSLGAHARRQKNEYDIIRSRIDRLATETDERAQYLIEENGRGIYVYVAEGQRSVPSHTRIGKIRYLNTCASGKSILAHLPRERVESIIEQWGLKQQTSNTITDTEQLFAELEGVRRQGYAINREESADGLLAIGAPVSTPNGAVLGAVSLSGPVHRMQDSRIEDELLNQLLGTIEEIELNTTFASSNDTY